LPFRFDGPRLRRLQLRRVQRGGLGWVSGLMERVPLALRPAGPFALCGQLAG
jgi:hypothetical protein